jgi:hypothetical protein
VVIILKVERRIRDICLPLSAGRLLYCNPFKSGKAFLYLHLTKTKQMKILIGSLLLMFSIHGFSQSPAKFYFDKNMRPAPKKEAVIYGTGTMDSGLYQLTCYYQKKKHPLACVAYFKDSTQQLREGQYRFYFENGTIGTEGNYRNGKKEGLWIDYHENGTVADSAEYKNGWVVFRTGFYEVPGKKQRLVTIDDVANNKFQITLYATDGEILSQEKIPQDYTGIYFNDDTLCTFPGGPRAWQGYITKAIINHLDDLDERDYGTLLLRFVVDTAGNITDVKPITMQNSTLAKIGYDAMVNGPKWIPGQHDGKNVKMIMIQPVTIQNPDKHS